MASDIEAELAELKQQEQRARQAVAKGEVQREAAAKALSTTIKTLQDEFDVRPEDGPALLARLEAEARAEADKVRTALAEAQQ